MPKLFVLHGNAQKKLQINIQNSYYHKKIIIIILMLERNCLKCGVLTAIVLTILSVCILVAVITYQGVTGNSGFNPSNLTVTSCPTNYLNTKLSAIQLKQLLTFCFACLELLMIIIVLILLVCGLMKLRERIIMQFGDLESNDKGKNYVFFSRKGAAALHIFYSLAVIFNVLYFGIMFSYTLDYFVCKQKLSIEHFVLAILSGISLLFLLICCAILVIVVIKFNCALEDNKKEIDKAKLYTMIELTEMNIKEPEYEENIQKKKIKSEKIRDIENRDYATFQVKDEKNKRKEEVQNEEKNEDFSPNQQNKDMVPSVRPSRMQRGNEGLLWTNRGKRDFQNDSQTFEREIMEEPRQSTRRRKKQSQFLIDAIREKYAD